MGAQVLHDALNELFGLGQLPLHQLNIQSGAVGIPGRAAVDGVLADEYQSLGETVEADSQPAAVAPIIVS